MIKGSKSDGPEVLDLLEGLKANELLSYSHLLTGKTYTGGTCLDNIIRRGGGNTLGEDLELLVGLKANISGLVRHLFLGGGGGVNLLTS